MSPAAPALTQSAPAEPSAFTRFAGRPVTFASAGPVIIVWALSGPIFSYSDTRRPVIGTGTSVVPSLMAFAIQNSESRR